MDYIEKTIWTLLRPKSSEETGVMEKKDEIALNKLGMIMIQGSKELMNYWNKIEPADKNVSWLFCFQSELEFVH